MNAKKIVAALLAAVLLIGVGVGGTLAWLYDFTNEVQNTFTVGNINIDLQETVNGTTESAKDNAVENNTFKIVPGTTQSKDPKVIVAAGSEDCYVFVEIIEFNNPVNDADSSYGINGVKFINWEIAVDWIPVEGKNNVYYRMYTGDAEATYQVLNNDRVSYSDTLTKAQLDGLQKFTEEVYENNPADGLPSLTFKAYAVQMDYSEGVDGKFSPEQAWDVANGLNPGVTTP